MPIYNKIELLSPEEDNNFYFAYENDSAAQVSRNESVWIIREMGPEAATRKAERQNFLLVLVKFIARSLWL